MVQSFPGIEISDGQLEHVKSGNKRDRHRNTGVYYLNNNWNERILFKGSKMEKNMLPSSSEIQCAKEKKVEVVELLNCTVVLLFVLFCFFFAFHSSCPSFHSQQ